MQTMHIEISEAEHAFRINGVTFAKRHLINTMAEDTNGDQHKMLAKFLVIVPFLATAYTPSKTAPESIKYGAVKAKRLYEALGINEDNTVPFMLVALEQAESDIKSIGQNVREAGFYENGKVEIPFREGGSTETFSPSSPRSKPTLH